MSKGVHKERGGREEDLELIKAFQARRTEAFDELVLKYKDRIFSLCSRILGNYEEANDAAQDVFVMVYRNLIRFREEAAFSTWLYRIAVNICKNKLASLEYKIRRRTASLQGDSSGQEECRGMEVSDERYSPRKIAEMKEKKALIEDAIAGLKEDYRTIIVLRDVEGLSYEEVARVTRLSLGTVKSRIARARQRLRDKLKGVFRNEV